MNAYRAPPPIRFRHIALLLVGGIVGGAIVALFAVLVTYAFTRSRFVAEALSGTSVYGCLVLAYHWISQEQEWVGIRARFAPVNRKILLVSALGGVGLVALIVSAVALLKWAGVRINDVPNPMVLPTRWTQMPLALLLIGMLAPVCEELLFRGLLLDWLKQKMNVWLAATVLSVIFSLLHANPFASGAIGWVAFADRFLLGLGASALTIKYGSLRPAVVLHATLNTLACIASVSA